LENSLEVWPINLDLTGKTALVCGASKGIGRASAFQLAQLNANVILLARSETVLEKLAKELPGPGIHSYLALDISALDNLKEVISSHISSNGPVHILVNNTGGPKGGPVAAATEEEFSGAFRNHVIVNSILAGLVLPGMKAAGFGRIINIISTSVKIPIPNLGVSNTVRAAVANWAKTLSAEVGPFGITVNNVLPGYTSTERLAELIENAAAKSAKTREQVEAEWIASVPVRRFADPKEVAAAVAFLASPAASYINGINLPVDGGRTGSL
jgi:3-oxoacyl-[acyl-carrier protein] reductase